MGHGRSVSQNSKGRGPSVKKARGNAHNVPLILFSSFLFLFSSLTWPPRRSLRSTPDTTPPRWPTPFAAMPRENSFSDSEGRSLTPDPEEGFASSPTYDGPTAERLPAPGRPSIEQTAAQSAPVHVEYKPHHLHLKHTVSSPADPPTSHAPPQSAQRPIFSTPKDRFRATVRKVMAMRRTSSLMTRRGIGAEPGVDPRRASAFLNYGHIRQQCLIEVNDYSTMRTSFGRMTNAEFIRLLADPSASRREPWTKVRWINIGGISWDVISALALKYGAYPRPFPFSASQTCQWWTG